MTYNSHVIGHLRWLTSSIPGKTKGKVYPIVATNQGVGIVDDTGACNRTWPADEWSALVQSGLKLSYIELCDKDGVKLCT